MHKQLVVSMIALFAVVLVMGVVAPAMANDEDELEKSLEKVQEAIDKRDAKVQKANDKSDAKVQKAIDERDAKNTENAEIACEKILKEIENLEDKGLDAFAVISIAIAEGCLEPPLEGLSFSCDCDGETSFDICVLPSVYTCEDADFFCNQQCVFHEFAASGSSIACTENACEVI